MESKGIIQDSFETNIYPDSLRFKDAQLEKDYVNAKTEFKLLSANSKFFLLAALLGHFIFALFDIIAALGLDPNYTLSTEAWVFYSLMIPSALCEAICFLCTKLSPCRGIVVTILGCLILFHNDFNTFSPDTFYPFLGIE